MELRVRCDDICSSWEAKPDVGSTSHAIGQGPMAGPLRKEGLQWPASSWAKPPASAAQAPESSELDLWNSKASSARHDSFQSKGSPPHTVLAFSGRKEKENQPGVNSL